MTWLSACIDDETPERLIKAAYQLLEEVEARLPKDGVSCLGPVILTGPAFMRLCSLYRGALMLIEAQLPEEANILLRSMFTECLRLLELQKASLEGQWAMVLHWQEASRQLELDMLESYLRLDLPEPLRAECQARIQQAKDGCKVAAQFREAMGIRSKRRFSGSEKQAAEKCGMTIEYARFSYLNQLVHGNATAYGSRLAATAEKVTAFGGTDDPDVLTSALLLAMGLLARGYTAAAELLRLGDSGWIKDFVDEHLPTPKSEDELVLW